MTRLSLCLASSLFLGCIQQGLGNDVPDGGFAPVDLALTATCSPNGVSAPVAPTSPQFGAAQSLATAPPPVAGGTLLALADGKTLVAADPDRDVIEIVHLENGAFSRVGTVTLASGDEPGRAVQDAAGKVHVVARRGGAIVDLDPVAGTLLGRRSVCPAPRGIAYQATGDLLHVACAGGELVSLPATGGAATRTVQLDADLRDVVVSGTTLYVSRFRSAELLTVASDGSVSARQQPADSLSSDGRPFTPSVAWRTIAANGQVYMLHQRGTVATVNTNSFTPPSGDLGAPPTIDLGSGGGSAGGYGGSLGTGGDTCASTSPIVQASITPFGSAAAGPLPPLGRGVVPVDIAANAAGNIFAVVNAGESHAVKEDGSGSLQIVHIEELVPGGPCLKGFDPTFSSPVPFTGQPIAVTFIADQVVVQTRKPATLSLVQPMVPPQVFMLDSDASDDTGHAVFHADSGSGIACASCHPEGGEDGRVWNFDFGPRRTQSLRGGILPTAPFHWSGDQQDIPHLFGEVFVKRMGGPLLACDQVGALGDWINQLPLLPHASPDAQAVARGKTLFENDAGCAACHAGPMLTNNATLDVGSGGPFQVPSLRGVWARAPYLHHGQAKTLTERFTMFGSDQHGHTSQLSTSQIADLVAYLESL